MSDLGVELPGSSSLRVAVEEFVRCYGEKSRGALAQLRALTAEHEKLSANFRLVEASRAEAEVKVESLLAQLAVSQAGEAAAQEQVDVLGEEMRVALEVNAEAQREIASLREEVARLREALKAEETARAAADTRSEQLVAEAADSKKRQEKLLKMATDTSNTLRAELAKLRDESSSAVERLGELTQKLMASEERAESTLADAKRREAELRTSKDKLEKLVEKLGAEREELKAAHEQTKRAMEERLETAARAAALAADERAAKEAEIAKRQRAELARAEAAIRGELEAARKQIAQLSSSNAERDAAEARAEVEAINEASSRRELKLQIRARVATTIPAGSMVLISPLTDGRSKELGELVGTTLKSINEGGGIKVKVMPTGGTRAKACSSHALDEEMADAAMSPASWTMQNTTIERTEARINRERAAREAPLPPLLPGPWNVSSSTEPTPREEVAYSRSLSPPRMRQKVSPRVSPRRGPARGQPARRSGQAHAPDGSVKDEQPEVSPAPKRDVQPPPPPLPRAGGGELEPAPPLVGRPTRVDDLHRPSPRATAFFSVR